MAFKGLRRKKFYGWAALAGAALSYFSCAGGLYYSYGVFLSSMCKALDWSRAALSGPYSLLSVLQGAMAPLAGISVAKFGPRRNIIMGNLVAAIGLACMFLTKHVWHVYLFYSVLVGASMTFSFSVATATVINNWFKRRRSLAMSLFIVSGGMAGFGFPLLINWFISGWGWRLAWVYVAVVHLVLAVVSAGVLVKNKPEDMGQSPDGDSTDRTQQLRANKPSRVRVYETPVDWEVKDALRTRAFWMMGILVAATFFATNTLLAHQVVYLEGLGFPSVVASTTLSLFMAVSIAGRFASGALGTRFEGRHLAAVCIAAYAIAIIILMNAKTVSFIYLYAALGGFGYGGLLVIEPAMAGAYFGRTHYAKIMGWRAAFTTLLSASAPLQAGLIYDYTGSYIPAFIVVVAVLGMGLMCALLACPPKHRMTLP